MPSLTAIVPNYNHGHLIGPQLEAILSQSLRPTLIVIDDGSTDDSVARIRQLVSGRDNVQLVCKERNAGVIAAMNEALGMASSDYITFAAADDLVLPGLYEKSVHLLEQYPQAALCSAVTRIRDRRGQAEFPAPPAYPLPGAGFVGPQRVRESLLHMESWFMGTTAVHRRRCVVEAGGFRPSLRSYCDGFLYLTEALRHGACFIPEPLAVWNCDERGYSVSTGRDDEAMHEILATVEGLMAGELADAFPPKLRARIKRRLRFRAMSAKAMKLGGAGKFLRMALFCLLRPHDLPIEMRSRLWKGRIAGA